MSTIVGLLVVLGAGFFFVAGVGVIRLPDAFCRMHAASKASSAGIGLVMLATAIHFGDVFTVLKCVLVIAFIFLSTPVAAHILARAAYLKKAERSSLTSVDEIASELRLEN